MLRVLPEPLIALEADLEQRLLVTSYRANPFDRSDAWMRAAKEKHAGDRCFVIGTGPSLNQLDLDKLRGETTFGVNGTFKLAQDVDLDYFVYVSNWYLNYNADGIRNVHCKRRFIPKTMKVLASKVPTTWLNVKGPRYRSLTLRELQVPAAFSKDPGRFIVAGGSVLFLCLQLAYYMGFQEVVLIGVDHSYGGKGDDRKAKRHGGTVLEVGEKDTAHFDADYVPGGISYPVDLKATEEGFRVAKRVFEADGRVIRNATPGTRLDVYQKVDYNTLF